jgi:hypothetical protein
VVGSRDFRLVARRNEADAGVYTTDSQSHCLLRRVQACALCERCGMQMFMHACIRMNSIRLQRYDTLWAQKDGN